MKGNAVPVFSGKNPGPSILAAWAEQARQDAKAVLIGQSQFGAIEIDFDMLDLTPKPALSPDHPGYEARERENAKLVDLAKWREGARERAAYRAGELPKDRPAPPPMIALIEVTAETRQFADSAMECARELIASASSEEDVREVWRDIASELVEAEIFSMGGLSVGPDGTDWEPLPDQAAILDQFAANHRDAWPGQAEQGGLFAWYDARDILRKEKWAVLKAERAAAERREAEIAERKAKSELPVEFRVVDSYLRKINGPVSTDKLKSDLRGLIKRNHLKDDEQAQNRLVEGLVANAHVSLGKIPARRLVADAVGDVVSENKPSRKVTGNIINQDDFKDQLAYARAKLEKAHANEPGLFRYGTRVGRVERVAEEGTTSINVLSKDAMRAEINKVTSFKSINGKGDFKGKATPLDVAGDLFHDHQLPLPYLRGVSTYPQFDADGVFLAKDGYHKSAYLFMQLPDDLVLPNLSTTPTKAEVTGALRLLTEEWLADFPFDGYSRREILVACGLDQPRPGEEAKPVPPSLANFLGFILQMITRAIIGNHPVPATLITKPESGTGASLLVSLVQLLITGKPSVRPPFPKDQDEQRKEVLAALLGGDPFIFLDNVVGNLDSPVLASLLTSTYFTGRILGRSEEVSVPNQASTVITGNNPRFTRELQRRLSLVRLNAGTDHPERRDDWHLDDIEEWTRANRGELLGALATLVMHWQAQPEKDRKPKGTLLASYRAWYNVVGGVLTACGLGEAFQANRDQIEMVAENDDDDPMREFVGKWFEVATKPGTDLELSGAYAKDLATLASAYGIELPVAKQMVDGERVYKNDAFGKYLGMQVERVFAVDGVNLRIEPGKKTKSGKPWELVVLHDE